MIRVTPQTIFLLEIFGLIIFSSFLIEILKNFKKLIVNFLNWLLILSSGVYSFWIFNFIVNTVLDLLTQKTEALLVNYLGINNILGFCIWIFLLGNLCIFYYFYVLILEVYSDYSLTLKKKNKIKFFFFLVILLISAFFIPTIWGGFIIHADSYEYRIYTENFSPGNTIEFNANHKSLETLAGSLEEITLPGVAPEIIPRSLNKFEGIKACINLFTHFLENRFLILPDSPFSYNDNLYFQTANDQFYKILNLSIEKTQDLANNNHWITNIKLNAVHQGLWDHSLRIETNKSNSIALNWYNIVEWTSSTPNSQFITEKILKLSFSIDSIDLTSCKNNNPLLTTLGNFIYSEN